MRIVTYSGRELKGFCLLGLELMQTSAYITLYECAGLGQKSSLSPFWVLFLIVRKKQYIDCANIFLAYRMCILYPVNVIRLD